MDFKAKILIGKIIHNYVLIHSLTGIAVGYFLLHPITMVIYWFEINQNSFTLNGIVQAFVERFAHAFYLHMMPMSVAFAFIGGIMGLVSGLYFAKVRKQDQKIQSQRYQLKESIQSIIRNGENEKVEFKSSLRYDFRKGQPNKILEEVIAKSIAGFMNADGGMLLIGVDDRGYLLGLDNDYVTLGKQNRDGFEQRLMLVIADKLGTDICPLIHVTFHMITDWEVCSIYIEKSHRPVYIREGENPVFYLRTGNITKSLNTQETVEYLKTKVHFK